MKSSICEAPNKDYLEMNFVGETATGRGNNQQFIMENLGDGTFRATEARVGISIGRHRPRSYVLPIEEWETVFHRKAARGYLVTKTCKMEKKILQGGGPSVNGTHYKPIEDASVEQIVTRLLEATSAFLDSSYRIKIDDISDEMIAYGKSILNQLAEGFEKMSVAEFNNKLKTLYAAIPRRIDNLSKRLAKRKLEFNDMVAEEQELFDIMVSRVRSGQELNAFTETPTVLEAFHLGWRDVTEEEEKMIKKKLGNSSPKFIKAWKVTNNSTESRFNAYCNKEGLTDDSGISHLFHGSRTENFWSIVTKGLTINPSNVVISGKMFGNGTYFAPLAKKSLRYTSRNGATYTNGSEDSGFLAIYKVATGKHYDVTASDSSLTWKNLQAKCPGAHCTWAHAGAHLINDEVIVYQDCQSTIEYLIEMSA